jgi:hypothetical protein
VKTPRITLPLASAKALRTLGDFMSRHPNIGDLLSHEQHCDFNALMTELRKQIAKKKAPNE